MNLPTIASGVVALALTGSLVAGSNQEASTELIFGQLPVLDDAGVFNAIPADKTCNVSCPVSESHAAAVAIPGTDLEAVVYRINQVEVWGIYRYGDMEPGSPPAEDSFTVKVHQPAGGPFDFPGSEVCSWSGIAGMRESEGNILGFDVYRHTLELPVPCVITTFPNRAFWIQVFNDTGSDDDWFWLAGYESTGWPPDCCWPLYGYATVADPSHAPGEAWSQMNVSLAFKLWTTYVGTATDLRLSKLPDDELLLEWGGDCGGGAEFSVYRGDLAQGYSSLAPEPGLCDVSGTSATVPVGIGTSDFFLVAPWVEAAYGSCVLYGGGHCRSQGSYGADSDLAARPQPISACYSQTSAQHDCAP